MRGKLNKLIESCAAGPSKGRGSGAYRLTIAFFPLARR
jgi:hypothetical protein